MSVPMETFPTNRTLSCLAILVNVLSTFFTSRDKTSWDYHLSKNGIFSDVNLPLTSNNCKLLKLTKVNGIICIVTWMIWCNPIAHKAKRYRKSFENIHSETRSSLLDQLLSDVKSGRPRSHNTDLWVSCCAVKPLTCLEELVTTNTTEDRHFNVLKTAGLYHLLQRDKIRFSDTWSPVSIPSQLRIVNK